MDPYLLKPIVNLLVFQQLYHTTNFFCVSLCDMSVIFPLGTTVAHPGSQSHQYLLAISA